LLPATSKKLRKWKDRKKWVEIPLISGYCFVYISGGEYDKVLQIANVVCFVTFEGKAAKIPDEQIDYLKRLLSHSDVEVSVSHENYEPGQEVEVIAGPMLGLRGELIKARGKQKFILRFQQINSIFTVVIDKKDLTFIPNPVLD